MTIGQFAQLSGLTPKALRGYDERGLLRPVEVDRATAYRRYAPSQLRRAATIKILRTMGMSMAQVREILDEPDRRAELVERYRAEVAAQHAAQAEAIAHGVATLNAYDQPVAVETRAAPAQPWVGAALAVDLGQVQLERDAQHYNDMFARLAQGLQQADVSIVGPFWTTIRAHEDGRGGHLLLCWPVAAAVDPTFVVAGLSLEHGTLPHRTEAFVRLALDNPQVLADPTSEQPPAEVVALLEYLEGPGPGRSEPTEIRQVGVLGEDSLPTAIDISVTTEVHPPSS